MLGFTVYGRKMAGREFDKICKMTGSLSQGYELVRNHILINTYFHDLTLKFISVPGGFIPHFGSVIVNS